MNDALKSDEASLPEYLYTQDTSSNIISVPTHLALLAAFAAKWGFLSDGFLFSTLSHNFS